MTWKEGEGKEEEEEEEERERERERERLYIYNTVVSLLRDHPHIQQKVVSQKRWSSTRGGRGNGLDQFVCTCSIKY